jgi:hypothetical protein
MAQKFFLTAVLCLPGFVAAEEPVLQVPKSSLVETLQALTTQDEVEVVGRLIVATQHQLEVQTELKRLMVEFKQQEDAFADGLQTKAHAAKMVRTARRLLELITDLHVQHLFSSQYMEELTLFSSIAGKTTPPRP